MQNTDKTTKTAAASQKTPTIAELQVQETLAINRLQHLENAIGEIQHLKRSVYDLTESRAKVARELKFTQSKLRDCGQRNGEMCGRIASLEGERDFHKVNAKALAEACRAGLKFLACAMENRENQAAFRRQLQTALAQWEGAK